MSNKKSSSRAIRTSDPAQLPESLIQRTYIMSFVLVFFALAKTATAALFDLGAIVHLTGDPGAHLAIESGMGRYCLIVAMLLFVGAGFGFNIKKVGPTYSTISQITWVNALVALASMASFVWGIVDGHLFLDILASLLGAAAAAAVAYCGYQLRS